MRSVRRWLPAFLVLFLAYQMPEGVGGRWLGQPVVAALLMLAFLPVAWLVARTLGLKAGQAYCMEWNRRNAIWLATSLALAFFAKGFAFWTGLRIGVYELSPRQPGAVLSPALIGTLMWLAVSTFVPSVSEDIVTRGFWARIPGVPWTGARFVLFTSVLYVLNHIFRLSNGPSEWLMLLCFGLAYASAFWRTGSLWPAIGLHWGWNFAGQALSACWPYDVLEQDLARLLSGASHFIILAVVVFLYPASTFFQTDRSSASY